MKEKREKIYVELQEAQPKIKPQRAQHAEKKFLEGVWGNSFFRKVSPRPAINRKRKDQAANQLPQVNEVREIGTVHPKISDKTFPLKWQLLAKPLVAGATCQFDIFRN